MADSQDVKAKILLAEDDHTIAHVVQRVPGSVLLRVHLCLSFLQPAHLTSSVPQPGCTRSWPRLTAQFISERDIARQRDQVDEQVEQAER